MIIQACSSHLNATSLQQHSVQSINRTHYDSSQTTIRQWPFVPIPCCITYQCCHVYANIIHARHNSSKQIKPKETSIHPHTAHTITWHISFDVHLQYEPCENPKTDVLNSLPLYYGALRSVRVFSVNKHHQVNKTSPCHRQRGSCNITTGGVSSLQTLSPAV